MIIIIMIIITIIIIINNNNNDNNNNDNNNNIYITRYVIIRYVSCMSVIVPSYIPTSISVASTAPSP